MDTVEPVTDISLCGAEERLHIEIEDKNVSSSTENHLTFITASTNDDTAQVCLESSSPVKVCLGSCTPDIANKPCFQDSVDAGSDCELINLSKTVELACSSDCVIDDVVFVDERSSIHQQEFDEQSAIISDGESQPLKLLLQASSIFKINDNFLRGCLWSPDGTTLLTNSADNYLRTFDVCQRLTNVEVKDELTSSLSIRQSELVYDYCWYPGMSASYPETCCFASTSRDNPVHLWDSLTGILRCTYLAFDQMDELTSAHSLLFSGDGQKLYCGFTKMIRVFDVSRPGRECESRPTYAKVGQSGIISCMALNPTMNGVYVAGSFNRSVAVYTEPRGEMVCMFQGQQGGVTHVQFSPDGNQLLSGGRKDPEILCWDMRNPGDILFTLQRQVSTNQRIYFDTDSTGRYIMSGNHDGSVSVWDRLASPVPQLNTDPVLPPLLTSKAHEETVNGLSCHPSQNVIATSSGQRHFSLSMDIDSDSDVEQDDVDSCDRYDNSLKIWEIDINKWQLN